MKSCPTWWAGSPDCPKSPCENASLLRQRTALVRLCEVVASTPPQRCLERPPPGAWRRLRQCIAQGLDLASQVLDVASRRRTAGPAVRRRPAGLGRVELGGAASRARRSSDCACSVADRPSSRSSSTCSGRRARTTNSRSLESGPRSRRLAPASPEASNRSCRPARRLARIFRMEVSLSPDMSTSMSVWLFACPLGNVSIAANLKLLVTPARMAPDSPDRQNVRPTAASALADAKAMRMSPLDSFSGLYTTVSKRQLFRRYRCRAG